MPLNYLIRNIYDTTSWPWDYVRSNSRFSRRVHGLGWQFETNTSASSELTARIRATLGAHNLMGRYCSPNKAYAPGRSPNGNGVWCPLTTDIATNWGANVHDATLSPYLHTGTPYNDANRKQYLTSSDFWLRMGQENVLDYAFGKPDGSGKRADGSDCFVVAQHLNVDPNVRVLCQDSIMKDSLVATINEGSYDTHAEWWANYTAYLAAYQERIIQPRGLKLIGNLGLDIESYPYAESLIAYLDGVIVEHFFCRMVSASLSSRYAWNTGNYRLYNQIEILKHLVANNKMVILGQDWFLLPIYLTCASGTGYVKVYSKSDGRYLAVKHDGYNPNYQDFALSSYSTIADLISAVQTMFGSTITMQHDVVTYGCDYLAKYDNPQILANMAETSFTTTGAYVKAMEPSRYSWLTCLCLGVLAGVGANHNLYLGINPNSSTNWNNEMERATDLINIPLGYPDTTMSNYAVYPGESGTNRYYRKLVTAGGAIQAVAVLNWEDSAKTVVGADFDLSAFIDPFVTRFDSQYTRAGAAKVTSISLPAYAGTVLLAG